MNGVELHKLAKILSVLVITLCVIKNSAQAGFVEEKEAAWDTILLIPYKLGQFDHCRDKNREWTDIINAKYNTMFELRWKYMWSGTGADFEVGEEILNGRKNPLSCTQLDDKRADFPE